MPRRHWSVLEILVGCLPVEGIAVLRNRMPRRLCSLQGHLCLVGGIGLLVSILVLIQLSFKVTLGCLEVLRVKICLGGNRFLEYIVGNARLASR